MRFHCVLGVLWIILPSCALAKDPDCGGASHWPASIAFGQLKDAGITDNDKVDFSKISSVRFASEKIGKHLYRQVYDIKFPEKSGNIIEVITISDASEEECSMGNVSVFVVSKHLSTH